MIVSKEQMIEAIYEKIADKTLSFGCIVWGYNEIGDYCDYIIRKCKYSRTTMFGDEFIPIDKEIFQIINNGDEEDIINNIDYDFYGEIEDIDWDLHKIIGHQVMIGDILDYIEVTELSEFKSDYAFDILNKWKEKRKPIEDQPIECIKYIYNLIKDEQ